MLVFYFSSRYGKVHFEYVLNAILLPIQVSRNSIPLVAKVLASGEIFHDEV
jgi:hypothetical protein